MRPTWESQSGVRATLSCALERLGDTRSTWASRCEWRPLAAVSVRSRSRAERQRRRLKALATTRSIGTSPFVPVPSAILETRAESVACPLPRSERPLQSVAAQDCR
eukprot:scaffold1330_cov240-Pinguiococcus_pyrenoidosus.AAC.33